MARGKRAPSKGGTRTLVLEEDPIERLLERVEPAAPASEAKKSPQKQADFAPGMRTARIVSISAQKIEIAFRGKHQPVEAKLAEGVEREVVAQAHKNRDAVLVEIEPNAPPLVVGVIQTRIPREVVIKADTVHIEAEREILLRSKTAAVRLREDGDVELVGSRILAMSRGLFRLVGRVLRLN